MASGKTPKEPSQVLEIRAAVLRRPGGPLTIETLEMEGPRDDEVLVRIVASGICHTDIRYIDDWYGESQGPIILGHEGAGVVEKVGAKIKELRRGDHIVMSYQSCGDCSACRHGRPFDCLRGSQLNWGFQRPDGSNALQRSGAKRPPLPPAFKEILVADWIAHTEFNRKIWNDTNPFRLSLAPVLPLIQAPVLILWGDQDKMLDVGSVVFLEKNLKNHRTVIMKDTGHCPMIERPEETAKAYRSFLNEKR